MVSTTVRILTYNTHLFAGTVASTVGGLSRNMEFDDENRCANMIEKIKALRPDIIGLTEVWAKRYQQWFIDGLKDSYPYFKADDFGWSAMGSGLLLLSRYPLSNSSFTRYEDLTDEDSLSDKGFILALAHVGSAKMIIALTHTQAGQGDDSANRSRAARWSNLKTLQAALKDSGVDQMPAVVIGDLNVIAESTTGTPTPEYQDIVKLMAEVRFADAFRQAHLIPLTEHGYTCDAERNWLVGYFDQKDLKNRIRQRLDYLFVRGLQSSACQVLSDFLYQSLQQGRLTDLSDHYPLYGSFTLST